MQRIQLILALLLLPLVQAAGLSVKTAYTRFYEEAEIRPMGQYFGAKLIQQRFRSVVASQPETPAGQYFIVRLADLKSGAPASVRMTLYATDSKEPVARSWDLRQMELKRWLYLGLTGADWPDKEIQPLAWRIEFLDQADVLMAEWKSFLWELP